MRAHRAVVTQVRQPRGLTGCLPPPCSLRVYRGGRDEVVHLDIERVAKRDEHLEGCPFGLAGDDPPETQSPREICPIRNGSYRVRRVPGTWESVTSGQDPTVKEPQINLYIQQGGEVLPASSGLQEAGTVSL